MQKYCWFVFEDAPKADFHLHTEKLQFYKLSFYFVCLLA